MKQFVDQYGPRCDVGADRHRTQSPEGQHLGIWEYDKKAVEEIQPVSTIMEAGRHPHPMGALEQKNDWEKQNGVVWCTRRSSGRGGIQETDSLWESFSPQTPHTNKRTLRISRGRAPARRRLDQKTREERTRRS